MRGRLIVVSGPSGAGKSTLIRASLEEVPELAYSVSATTRRPRPGEVDGIDYIFLSRQEFERWIQEGRFLEWAEYSGNLYGTPERKVEEFLRATESEEALESRLATAVGEVAARDEFDHEVINENRGRARRDMIEKMESIVRGGKDAARP
ncbi:MAG: guanylate kinase [Rubrobacteraceae bacterium]|nr:guanylate kinase [Rubrobacteraceae bacterium]